MALFVLQRKTGNGLIAQGVITSKDVILLSGFTVTSSNPVLILQDQSASIGGFTVSESNPEYIYDSQPATVGGFTVSESNP